MFCEGWKVLSVWAVCWGWDMGSEGSERAEQQPGGLLGGSSAFRHLPQPLGSAALGFGAVHLSLLLLAGAAWQRRVGGGRDTREPSVSSVIKGWFCFHPGGLSCGRLGNPDPGFPSAWACLHCSIHYFLPSGWSSFGCSEDFSSESRWPWLAASWLLFPT